MKLREVIRQQAAERAAMYESALAQVNDPEERAGLRAYFDGVERDCLRLVDSTGDPALDAAFIKALAEARETFDASVEARGAPRQ
jgi:hypothetical protein